VDKALDGLVELLDLEQIELDIFRGRSPDEQRQRVFGGQVAGQALVAAGRTVPPDRPVHSLHAYFLRPGDPNVPILYEVDRIRDGRSFTTRLVVAIQHGRAIFNMSASFHVDEPGLSHQLPMPDVPPVITTTFPCMAARQCTLIGDAYRYRFHNSIASDCLPQRDTEGGGGSAGLSRKVSNIPRRFCCGGSPRLGAAWSGSIP